MSARLLRARWQSSCKRCHHVLALKLQKISDHQGKIGVRHRFYMRGVNTIHRPGRTSGLLLSRAAADRLHWARSTASSRITHETIFHKRLCAYTSPPQPRQLSVTESIALSPIARGAHMPDSKNRPICPGFNRPMKLELQPGGKTPRTFQCLDCERLDPLKSPVVGGILKALQPPE